MAVNWGLAGEPADPYGSFQRGRRDRITQQREDDAYGREEQQRSVNAAMAQAIGAEDYGGLQNIAAKSGDPELAQSAQSYRRQRLFSEAASSAAELEEIASIPDPNQQMARYSAWRQRSRAQGARYGVTDPQVLAEFEQTYPQQATPEQIRAAAQATRARVEALLRENMTPEMYVENQAAQARQARDDERLDLERQRVEQGERRLEAAIARGSGGGVSNLTPQQFSRANSLRDEFNTQSGAYRTLADIIARSETYVQSVARGTRPNAQSDIGLVYALAKAYDPTSVVREGEFATVARSGGFGPQIQSYVNRIFANGILPDEIRNGIMTGLRQTYQSQRGQYGQIRSRYEQLAQQSGIDPSYVIDDYSASGSPGGAPAVGGGANSALPPVTQRVINQVYDMPDGGQARWNGRGFETVSRPAGQ